MSREPVPPGFAHFADVIVRLGNYRPCGQGVTFQCLFPQRHKHGDRNWSGRAFLSAQGDLMAKCMGCGADRLEFMQEVGLPFQAWRTPAKRKSKVAARPLQRNPAMELLGQTTATYEYRDESGNLLFQKLRFEPKSFRCRRPLDQRHNKHLSIPADVRAWVWGVNDGEYGRAYRDGAWDLWPIKSAEHQTSMKLDAARRVLYRLPELLAANPEHPVFLVEGEKDVETLCGIGFVATCTWAGSNSLDPEWLAPLAGRRVVIVADNDTVGKAHAARQAGYLVCGGVRSLRVIWPGECGYDVGPGGDISDWLRDNKHPREAVIDLCKKFGEYRVW